MPEVYVVHYSEIILKGKNRPQFTRMLGRNIYRTLAPLGDVKLESKDGRFIVKTASDEAEVSRRLSKVFGVSWFAKASVTDSNLESIRKSVASSSEELPSSGTFMISAKRADKSFPMDSMELAKTLGSDVVKKTGKKVKLAAPDATIHVDVLRGQALIYTKKNRGPGGLPVGTSGRVMHLFSGGIDSPVAAWLMMKRGCKPIHLHFYLAPTPDYALNSKVTSILKVLSGYCGRSTLVLVPFAEYQMATSGLEVDLEPSLFRRFMRQTAEELAPRFGAIAISTGDALSQAASQTLWNLGVFDQGSSLPILRPLLTWDKEEIIDLGRKIGTYELSIQEYKDCCAIITRHPKTRVDPDLISEFARRVDFPSLVEKCVSLSTLVSYNPAKDETKVLPLANWERAGTREVAEEAEEAEDGSGASLTVQKHSQNY